MRHVSRFEADLLRIVHALVGRTPATQVLPLVIRAQPRPACLSRDAVDLVKDALRKGVTWRLAADGGWQNERFLRPAGIAAGRLWQRTPPQELGLHFSEFALDFLIWLTEANVASGSNQWEPFEPEALTLGDRLLLVLALDAFHDTEVGVRWGESPIFRGDGLCALFHPQLMARGRGRFEPDFTPWLTPAGQAVLESQQARLVQRWLEVEGGKGKISQLQEMQNLGRTQRVSLERFLQAVRAAGRKDLAVWLLVVGQRLLPRVAGAQRWTGKLEVQGLRLADRTEAYREALAVVRQIVELETWQREAINVGYFDEDYAAAQLWKSRWETYRGDASCAAAREILRHAEPLA